MQLKSKTLNIKLHQRNDDEYIYTIGETDLMWLLHCTRDIVKKDLVLFKDGPLQDSIQNNLDALDSALNMIEEEE